MDNGGLILIVAAAFTCLGGLVGFLADRARAAPSAVLASMKDVVDATQEQMKLLSAEVKEARVEADAARAFAGQVEAAQRLAQREWYTERGSLQRQIDDLQAAVTLNKAYIAALLRAIREEPVEVAARILARVPPEGPAVPHAGTGPLGWRALFPTQAENALLALLLTRLDVFGAAEGRALLLTGCPDEWISSLRRGPTPREDLTAILESAARYDAEVLGALLSNAMELVGPGSETGPALAAWRATWKL
jgi:hypothetical protein